MQFGVNFDDYNHPKIPHHSDTVDGEEYQEEGHSQLWVIGEAQESEHSPSFISLWEKHGFCLSESESVLEKNI